MKKEFYTILFFLLPMVLCCQDLESLLENSVEDSDINISLNNYMEDPIFIKKIKLNQLKILPLMTEEKAISLYKWIKMRKYITYNNLKKFINDDDIFNSLLLFITFEKSKYYSISNSTSFLNNKFHYDKTKCFVHYKYNSIYFRRYNYINLDNRYYWSYSWKNEFFDVRVGDFYVSSPLKLIGGGNFYNSPTYFHMDEIYDTAPNTFTNSMDGQFKGFEASAKIKNSKMLIYSSNNKMYIKNNMDEYIDFYSNPFGNINSKINNKNNMLRRFGLMFWQKINSRFALSFSYLKQELQLNKENIIDTSPNLYFSKLKNLNPHIFSFGFFIFKKFEQHKIEALTDRFKNFCYIAKHSFKLKKMGNFQISHFYYSPYILNISGKSYLTINSLANNSKGIIFESKIGSSKKYITVYFQKNSNILDISYNNTVDIKNQYYLLYNFTKNNYTYRIKIKRKKYLKDYDEKKETILDFLVKQKLKGGSYVNLTFKTAGKTVLNHRNNISVGTKFHYISGTPLRIDVSWQIFQIKQDMFGFYEDELSYYPGIEWLRLSRNGFKLVSMLKWTKEKYSFGIKFRKIWKYSDDVLSPTNYFWLFGDIYAK